MSNTALLLIDVQQGFNDPKWGVRNNIGAEVNIAKLLDVWRKSEGPVIHIQHHSSKESSPLYPGTVGCQFKPEAAPRDDEMIFTKNVNSAFIGTKLEAYLRKKEIEALVIVGLTTDHCVSTTTRMAGNLGFNVMVVSDATATFNRQGVNEENFTAEIIHSVSLASLNKEFCRVLSTDQVIAELSR